MAEGLTDYQKSMMILKRIDPHTNDILARVDKVSLYVFCYEKKNWEDNGIEGEFFICSRDIEPYSSLHILNYKKKNNFIELIHKDWDWRMDEPLLLYRKGETIFGIELYDIEDYTKITTLVSNIMNSSKQKEEPKTKRKLSGSKIMSMLNQAQEDFQKVTTMIGNQYSQSQPSTSKMNTNFDTNDGSSSFFPNRGTTIPKIEDKDKSQAEVEELETLASALSLMDETRKSIDITPDISEYKKSEDFNLPSEEKPEPLDREQMQQAMMYLMKNDSDFLRKLHETYIKSCLNLI